MHVYFLSSDLALATDYVPQEEVIQTLAKYLSELTLTEERGVKFCRLPEKKLPQGFHVTYKRCSKDLCMKSGQASQPFFPRKALGVLMGLTRIPENRYFLTIVFIFTSFFKASTPVVISSHDSFLPFL